MAGARQFLLHFSRSAMLHHTLFGIGWITYRIGWITYRIGWITYRIGWIRLELAGLWQEAGQRSDCFYCIFTRFGAASYFLHLETSGRKCGAAYTLVWETYWEKTGCIWECFPPKRLSRVCFISFTTQHIQFEGTAPEFKPIISLKSKPHSWFLSPMPLVACCWFFPWALSWSLCSTEGRLRRRWLLPFYISMEFALDRFEMRCSRHVGLVP